MRGLNNVAITWIVVVLPAPLGPSNENISPLLIVNEIPSIATTSLNFLTRFSTTISSKTILPH